MTVRRLLPNGKVTLAAADLTVAIPDTAALYARSIARAGLIGSSL